MPAAPPRSSIRQALEEGVFEPVYYLHGDDDYQKDDAVRRLIERALEPATRELNLEQRSGAELGAEDFGILVNTLPMMCERRMLVIRDVAALRKDVRAALDTYLKNPAAHTVLVLTSPAGTRSDTALVRRTTAIELPPLTDKQLPAWISRHAQQRHGVSITRAAAALLLRVAGPDLNQLASELEKLASHAQGSGRSDEIDEAAVSFVVGVRHGETMGDLLDRIGERDIRGALAILPHVLLQPKTSAVVIVMALATQMLALSWARAALDEGLPRSQLYKGLMERLKQGGSSFTGRPWGEAVSAWMRQVDGWTPPALERALDLLLDADMALKESRVSSDEQLLATLTLALCADAVQGAAA